MASEYSQRRSKTCCHWTTYRNDHKQIIVIETYIAYRLPNSTDVHYLKGNGQFVEHIKSVAKDGFVLHDFLGSKILYTQELKSIASNQFQTYIHKKPLVTNTKKQYTEVFKKLIKDLQNGKFKKVILSRTKLLPRKKSPLEIFDTLNQAYKNTFNYIISNQAIGTWMGASPETLLEAKKNLVNTMSLAGTKQEGEEWTDKEIEEQDLVTQTIKRAFNKANCKELNIEGPNTIKAGQVQHLHTHISAILNKSDDWKPLLQTLHPTPAVCGIPTEEARKFIVENEKYNRAYYTGFLGVLAENKKQFFVNLRCMEIFEETALLYIGGGITAKSNLEKEWQETERKSLTLANHLN